MKNKKRGFTMADIPESIKRLNSQIFNGLPPRIDEIGKTLVSTRIDTKDSPKRQQMNKLETEFFQRLKRTHPESLIKFQPFRLYLANGHSYRPDFVVFSESIEVYEVKGPYIHSRDSRILFDQAAQEFPWRFFWARKTKEWRIECVTHIAATKIQKVNAER